MNKRQRKKKMTKITSITIRMQEYDFNSFVETITNSIAELHAIPESMVTNVTEDGEKI